MNARRCLFVPNDCWSENGHISAGVHLWDDENGFNAIVDGDTGEVLDGCACTTMWEEQEWGADPWHILLGQVENVDFGIDEKLYSMVDEVYNTMCMDVEPSDC